MSDKTIDIFVKSGAVGLCALMIWLSYRERTEARKENMDRLMPVLESLAESMEEIAETYSPK